MVTKLYVWTLSPPFSSVLAKIHMVTKQSYEQPHRLNCSVLAKIHMVTKHYILAIKLFLRSVLAKIHMVTKQIALTVYS